VGEGLLIGIGYFVAGVPNPVMFTILTTAFAMLPFGAWLAFTTAALVLVSGGGSGFAAVAVFCWGRDRHAAIISFGRTWSAARRVFRFSSHLSASSEVSLPSGSSVCF
jgi:hypothetical protein